METYRVILINSQGVVFDSGDFSSLAKVHEWARGRGERYSVSVLNRRDGSMRGYLVVNNRMTLTFANK